MHKFKINNDVFISTLFNNHIHSKTTWKYMKDKSANV